MASEGFAVTPKRSPAKDLAARIGAPRSRPAPDRSAERRLLQAARRGDRQATERLLSGLMGTVHRFGRGFCRNAEEAEDLTQDVLHTLLSSLSRFRGDSSLSTWAFTVARRVCMRRKRRMARHTPLEPLADLRTKPSPQESPDERAERRELAAAIERAVAALPPGHREVVLLRDVEGLTAPEVAKVLGIGQRAVKSRLHRARLELRTALAPYAAMPRPADGALRCPDTARLLSRYLEGELDSRVCNRLSAHVAKCGACKQACDSLREVLDACRAWGESPLPPSERRRVRQAIREVIRDLTV